MVRLWHFPHEERGLFTLLWCSEEKFPRMTPLQLRGVVTSSVFPLACGMERVCPIAPRAVRVHTVNCSFVPRVSLESGIVYVSTSVNHHHANGILGHIRPVLPLNPGLSTGLGVFWSYGIYRLILHCAPGMFWPCCRVARSVSTAACIYWAADHGLGAGPGTKDPLNTGASLSWWQISSSSLVLALVPTPPQVLDESLSCLVLPVLIPHFSLAMMLPPYWASNEPNWLLAPWGLASPLSLQNLWDSSRSRSRLFHPPCQVGTRDCPRITVGTEVIICSRDRGSWPGAY